MMTRVLTLALCLCGGQTFAASKAEPAEATDTPAAPEPVTVPAPIPSTGLSETILDRTREKLVKLAPRELRDEDK